MSPCTCGGSGFHRQRSRPPRNNLSAAQLLFLLLFPTPSHHRQRFKHALAPPPALQTRPRTTASASSFPPLFLGDLETPILEKRSETDLEEAAAISNMRRRLRTERDSWRLAEQEFHRLVSRRFATVESDEPQPPHQHSNRRRKYRYRCRLLFILGSQFRRPNKQSLKPSPRRHATMTRWMNQMSSNQMSSNH
ncbi:hypothetical protein ACSBR1_011000 [Camellia fascicularis]